MILSETFSQGNNSEELTYSASPIENVYFNVDVL